MSVLQAEDATPDELVKLLKQGEKSRLELIENFTRKVDSDCAEFFKAVATTIEDSNSGTVERKHSEEVKNQTKKGPFEDPTQELVTKSPMLINNKVQSSY